LLDTSKSFALTSNDSISSLEIELVLFFSSRQEKRIKRNSI
jgi:hypothetical protein